MDLIISQSRNEIIWALQRCGTNHLRTLAASSIGDWKVLYNYKRIPNITDIRVTKLVRDPVQRWLSWFTSFIIDDPEIHKTVKKWSTKDVETFFTDFEKTMNDDGHTMLQSIGYFECEPLNYNNNFVLMENVDIYLKITRRQHQPAFKEEFYNLDASIQNRIISIVYELYTPDYAWLDDLELTLALPTKKG